jgi:phosphatidate cytidylyltransferase
MANHSDSVPTGPTTLPRDLVPRLVSSLLLASVAVLFDYAGRVPFAVLVLAAALVMCWEWGKVVRGEGLDGAFAIQSAAVGGAGILAVNGLAAIGLSVLIIGAILILVTRFGEHARLSSLGVLYVGVPVVALLWVRSDEPYGAQAVLLIFVLVWSADIFAYIGGRLIGGMKLWPRVSPNKTWSGLLSGVAASALAGALFALFVEGASPAALAASGFALALIAQAGDLAESALKRGFGVKDTSSLIPGHGGFMDRLDGVVAVAVVAGLIGLAVNSRAPAHALLFWS